MSEAIRTLVVDDEKLARDRLSGFLGKVAGVEVIGEAENGLEAVQMIKERRPGIIAIDSFKALAAFADDPRDFRRFLHDLAALLTAFPATCFWIGEYSEDEARSAPEFAVADGIISLATERVNERTLRLIHYSAWIARRWDDPAFPAAFPWFSTQRFWQDKILELREQIALMQEEPLSVD